MYFATAGIEVAIWIPPVVAFGVSLLTSMGGISGAFLLMPFQLSVLGYTSPSLSATNQLFNVVAIPSGVYRYIKEQRMVWPLTWAVILGTLPGVIIGAIIRVRYLPDPKNFKIFAGVVLLYIGLRMARDVLQCTGGSPQTAPTQCSVNVLDGTRWRIRYEFDGKVYECSRVTILVMCLVIGIIGGIYGIGGGAIVAPFFVSICGLPVYTIAGATLMGTLVTSVAGVAFYQLLAVFHAGQAVAPDWGLGMLFGLGGFCGMYCGARMQKHVPAVYIKVMLCVIILGTAIHYMSALFR